MTFVPKRIPSKWLSLLRFISFVWSIKSSLPLPRTETIKCTLSFIQWITFLSEVLYKNNALISIARYGFEPVARAMGWSRCTLLSPLSSKGKQYPRHDTSDEWILPKNPLKMDRPMSCLVKSTRRVNQSSLPPLPPVSGVRFRSPCNYQRVCDTTQKGLRFFQRNPKEFH